MHKHWRWLLLGLALTLAACSDGTGLGDYPEARQGDPPPTRGAILGHVTPMALNPGVQVRLFDVSGALVETTYTDGGGWYIFPDPDEGIYYLRAEKDNWTNQPVGPIAYYLYDVVQQDLVMIQ